MRTDPLRTRAFGLFSLLLLTMLLVTTPASAQRGRTGGERKSETKQEESRAPERRAPEPRSETRREERQPTQRAEPQREERRTEPAPRREPETPRAPESRTERTERGRSTETTRPARSTGRETEPSRGGRTTEPTRTTRTSEQTPRGRTTETTRPTRTPERATGRGATTQTTTRSTGNRGGQVVRATRRVANRERRDYRSVPKRRYTWHHIDPVPHRGYHYQHAAPVVVLDFDWPWEHRYRRSWSPRYRYRQVVYIDAGYGGRYWDSRLEVRTTYRQRVRRANGREAELDLDIEALELYQDGRYLGRVTRIPDRFGRVRARVRRNGQITFDRDVFVVGSREVGFELVSTSRYDGYVLSKWRRGDDFDVAHLDLRRNRVRPVRESRLFDPYGYSGYAPVSVLPEDERWLGDYGPYGVSTFAYDDDFYDDYGFDDTYYYGYGGESYNSRSQRFTFDDESALSLRGDSDDTFETVGGATIHIRREAEILRLE